MGFTDDQLKAIRSRNENLLVSAAAGSGKTTVLVERVMQLVTDEDDPCDIGQILVLTFTKAAAANMKNKIADAFRDLMKKKGNDPRLMRQSILVRGAKIMTIHSFCSSLIREHFPETGLEPGFRIAAEGETDLIRKDVFANVMEELYLSEDNEDFLEMCEALSSGQDDSQVEKKVNLIWGVAESYPWPRKWLEDHRSDYDGTDQVIMDLCKGEIAALLRQMEAQLVSAAALCDEPSGPARYRDNILKSLEGVRQVLIKLEKTGECTHDDLESIVFDRLPSKTKNDDWSDELKDRAKDLRDSAKEILKGRNSSDSRLEKLVSSFNEEEEIRPVCARRLHSLIDLVMRVMEAYNAEKERRGIIDFSDMEHIALRLLTRGEVSEDGVPEPSDIALQYRKTFREVMCDEYQDSSFIQELILSLIAGDDPKVCRRFMVGDVKQSIYGFRQARPEIFVQKYEEYGLNARGTDLRVILADNFRSRRSVTDSVNQVFEVIMKKEFGGVEYDENAMLRASAKYPTEDGPENETELLIATGPRPEDKADKTPSASEGSEMKGKKKAPDTQGGPDDPDDPGALETESRMIARRIRELMNSFEVYDGNLKVMRPVRYGDIAILIRSRGDRLTALRKVLEESGIPVSVTTSGGYFSALEVRTLLNFLETVSNPLEDVPLFGTMRGLLGDFDDEELARIKAETSGDPEEGKMPFWDRVNKVARSAESPLRDKALSFVNTVLRYREMARYTEVSGIIRSLLNETGYRETVSAMSGGARRIQNVQALIKKAEEYGKTSYSGVHDFVRYIHELQKYSIDFGEEDTEAEDSDAVRVMSIHNSKGLEFPVVFFSFAGKQFNDTDLNSQIVASPEYGVGMSHVDIDLRLSSTTLRKEFIVSKIRETTHGEELRLLYTAMTRAKEKLIITGYAKDPVKTMAEAEPVGDMLQAVISKKCFLDWLMLTPLAGRAKIIHANDTARGEEEMLQSLAERKYAILEGRDADEDIYEKTLKALRYTYPHPELSGIFSKTTVTKLKKLAMPEEGGSVLPAFPEAEDAGAVPSDRSAGAVSREEAAIQGVSAAGGKVPEFMTEGEKPLSGSFRGTAYHRVLAVMDLNAKDVNEELLRLEREGLISPVQRKTVRAGDIERFMKSGVFERMKKACNERRLWREQPFVSSAESMISSLPEGSTVIVQGIIDAMWEEDDGTVILDYKTDRVTDVEELKERYAAQLEIYGKAMDRRENRPKVKSLILYSIPLARMTEV